MSVRDVIQAAAGSATGDSKTYIEDVFSTYLYTGASAGNVNINNGIDLAGKGGMVWQKTRSAPLNNYLVDTDRGSNKYLISDLTNAQGTSTALVYSFNSNGFDTRINTAATVASWTFRKAPKFFDVVTYTGNGVAGRTVAHSLGSVPGMIIVKDINSNDGRDWYCYHRSLGNDRSIHLNLTEGRSSSRSVWNYTSPTETQFTLGGPGWNVNDSGKTYVAYLFAHDTTTDGLIQCGSFTTDASGNAEVTLGWEPQYLMVKSSSGVDNWAIYDNMRNFSRSGMSMLRANLSNAEYIGLPSTADFLHPTATGFGTGNYIPFSANTTYIYMAIRRGPMRTPTDATKVFSPVAYTGTGSSGRSLSTLDAIDTSWIKWRSGNPYGDSWSWSDRIRGIAQLASPSTSAEGTWTDHLSQWGPNQNTVLLGNGGTVNGSSMTYIQYAFKRAPGFFDVVCYTGTGAARTVNHSLGVAPELMIVKSRSYDPTEWIVYSNSLGANKCFLLNRTDTPYTGNSWFNSTSPTASAFTVNTDIATNSAGHTYVAYLFASCPGVSKVGSYTGNGSSQTINCGFSAGSRFVLIKRTDSTGDWYCWDTARGIVAATDPHLSLNTTAAEVTTDDTIDPDSTGFIVNQVTATNVNVNAATYIYLAIA